MGVRELILLRTTTSGGLWQTRWWTFGLRTFWKISWLNEELLAFHGISHRPWSFGLSKCLQASHKVDKSIEPRTYWPLKITMRLNFGIQLPMMQCHMPEERGSVLSLENLETRSSNTDTIEPFVKLCQTWHIKALRQRRPGVRKSRASGRPRDKILYGGPDVCGSPVWTLLHVTLLAPRILRWLPEFWKICAPLIYTNSHTKKNFKESVGLSS